MIRLLAILSLIAVIECVDHEVYKNCSRVEYCTNFRERASEDKYSFDPTSININADTGTASLLINTNDDSNPLTLEIWGLQGSSFRIKIKESENNRFEIDPDLVLNGEPTTIEFSTSNAGSETITLKTESDSNTLILTNSPLKLEFLKNDTSVLSIKGEDLILENSEQSQAFAFSVEFPEVSALYGIHEHAVNLALQETSPSGLDPYRLRNLEMGGYELNTPMSLYGAIPVLYGHGVNSTAGFFLHNAAEHWYDLKKLENRGWNAHVMVESGTLDLFIFLGPKLSDVCKQYAKITGTTHLPPIWTLGYHQSRYSYTPQEQVKEVLDKFDENNFQMDAIWLDIDYTDGKRYFTWDPETFSDPVDLQNYISSKNKKLVTIIDPHIKVDENYGVYAEANAQNLFVKNPDGTNFEGDCWPGTSSYIDFYNPEARDYISDMYSYEKFNGSTPTLAGIWNDMNEPAVFNKDTEFTIPGDCLHHNDIKHRNIHNMYGFLQTMSTYEGLMRRDNRIARPFILSRSHFAGTQRYAAIWTGDNDARWDYLAISYPMCLNANLLGIAFCGADVSGFKGGDYDDELTQRWYQAGAWLPFFRQHSDKTMERREPYLYEEEVQNVIRNAIQIRYKHSIVWYTTFYEHSIDGSPVIRPLVYQYPEDPNVFEIDNHLLLGENILVRPVMEPGVDSVQVYFPGGPTTLWMSMSDINDVRTGEGFVDIPVTIETIPMYYKVGSLIVRKDTVRRSTVEMEDDLHTLHAILDENNQATGRVYVDDHTSFKYYDNSEFMYAEIQVQEDWLRIRYIGGNGYKFEFALEAIVFYVIDKFPHTGEPGSYKKVVVHKDSNGTYLKQHKFTGEKDLMIKLDTYNK